MFFQPPNPSKSRGLTNLDEAPEPKKRQAFAEQHGYGFHLAGKAQAPGGGGGCIPKG